MRKWRIGLGCAVAQAAILCAGSVWAQNGIPALMLPVETNQAQVQLLWQTEPGLRYDLSFSSNLSVWSQAPGYPVTADQLSHEQTISPGERGYYRIGRLDEQPPRVAEQYPMSNAFAVSRFADIAVRLDDPAGIDTGSVRLVVGSIGPVGPGTEGFSVASNMVVFDSGATALGRWGATVTATLWAADNLGYVMTNTWSFRLEPEPITATNVFVFGSPVAQSLGQRVRGPAAVLAQRYPVSRLPMGTATADWSIVTVTTNAIILAYTNGPAPTFAAGQLVCNLTPARENEIFYRRVVSTSNDMAGSRLTITTEEVSLTNFVSQGAISLSDGSLILQASTNGEFVGIMGVSATLTFPRMGVDLSGTEIGVRENGGFEIKVKGVTYSFGNGLKWVNITFPEWAWWLTPRIQAGLEFDLQGLKSFEAIAQGDLSLATVVDIEVVLAGVSTNLTLYDLPKELERGKVLYVGQLGPLPVFATLGFDFKIEAEVEAKAQLEFGGTYRQDHSAAFGVTYERDAGLGWVNRFQSTAPDLGGSAALTGEFSFDLVFEPSVNFLVYGAAGMKAALEPSVGIETTVPLVGGAFDGKLQADLDFVLGTDGPLFDALGYEEELKLNIWHGEWPLTRQVLEFTTQPESKTVKVGDAVAFSCTVDASATPSFQWFHNGTPVPGETGRSLFRPRVNTGHAGTYYVRATAGNLATNSNPATLVVQTEDPRVLDTDGDGIPNAYETNTGQWRSSTDRGTNPNRWDSDGDGLSDGVESNTRTYVSRANTGTDPNRSDTDGDGVSDKRELDLGTDPNVGTVFGNYLVIDLSGGPTAASYPVSYLSAVPSGGWTEEHKTTKLVMRRIPAGTYTMGSPGDELGRDSNETQHQVTLTKDFYIGVFEVTQKQWERVMGTWPSWFNNATYRDSRPVEEVSYYVIREDPGDIDDPAVDWPNNSTVNAGSFVGKLRAKTGLTTLDLPTESQWEYACRAGTTTALNSGKNLTSTGSDANMAEVGRCGDNGGSGYSQGGDTSVGTARAGSYVANGWGLYDMHGNVWEWCLDWYGGYPGTATDPLGASSGARRVLRGGYWHDDARHCRSASRLSSFPSYRYYSIGFRLARTLP